MSNIICLVFGVLVGAIIVYIAYHDTLKSKDALIDDYKKGIDIHNKRELRLIFINQSTKDYVRRQLNILKKHTITTNADEIMTVTRYMAFKDIESKINHFEKNSEDLITKE